MPKNKKKKNYIIKKPETKKIYEILTEHEVSSVAPNWFTFFFFMIFTYNLLYLWFFIM